MRGSKCQSTDFNSPSFVGIVFIAIKNCQCLFYMGMGGRGG